MECRLGFVAVGFREPDMTYDFCKPDVIFDDPYACFTVRVLQPPLATYNKLNLIDTVQAVPAIFALAPDSPWFVLGSTFWRLFSTLRAAEAVQ